MWCGLKFKKCDKAGVHKYRATKLCTVVINSLVLYGCETWSLTLREERGLEGGYENRVLRRTFGHKRNEVTGEWRKLHNEELNALYCSPNIVRVIQSRRMRLYSYVDTIIGANRNPLHTRLRY